MDQDGSTITREVYDAFKSPMPWRERYKWRVGTTMCNTPIVRLWGRPCWTGKGIAVLVWMVACPVSLVVSFVVRPWLFGLWLAVTPLLFIALPLWGWLRRRLSVAERGPESDDVFVQRASSDAGVPPVLALAVRRTLGELYGVKAEGILYNDDERSLSRLCTGTPFRFEFLAVLERQLGRGPLAEHWPVVREWKCKTVSELLRACQRLLR